MGKSSNTRNANARTKRANRWPCDGCRKAKRGCDGENGQPCSSCEKEQCTYSKPPTKFIPYYTPPVGIKRRSVQKSTSECTCESQSSTTGPPAPLSLAREPSATYNVFFVGPTTQSGVITQPRNHITFDGRPAVLLASATCMGAHTSQRSASQSHSVGVSGSRGDFAYSSCMEPRFTGIANVPPNGVNSEKGVNGTALKVQSSPSHVVVLKRGRQNVTRALCEMKSMQKQ
ncbi:hypothetical protein SCHPADRAFT_486049 [Schizopora paradoxa]|uniref:Zn(2)-C6 fungal-type domain-containing protein n=1 Tax=Schizopora paradoxa TaxID=27342 RepID=A0A0H2RH54_9AGAM|nr:hypothetical protein SCHPADRAFT_486049 [Schizopora paradoxa]